MKLAWVAWRTVIVFCRSVIAWVTSVSSSEERCVSRVAAISVIALVTSVSRALRDRPFLAKLRGAGSDDALYALLVSAEARDAA